MVCCSVSPFLQLKRSRHTPSFSSPAAAKHETQPCTLRSFEPHAMPSPDHPLLTTETSAPWARAHRSVRCRCMVHPTRCTRLHRATPRLRHNPSESSPEHGRARQSSSRLGMFQILVTATRRWKEGCFIPYHPRALIARLQAPPSMGGESTTRFQCHASLR